MHHHVPYKGSAMSHQGKAPHILAIIDSYDVLELLEDLLSEEGFRVTTTTYLSHDLHQIEALQPNLLILGYMWGSDDSGWSFLQMLAMNPTTKDIPVVLCTGAVRQVTELDSRLKEMGIRVVLKPVDIDELVNAVKESLQPRTQSDDTPPAAAG